MLRTRAHDVPRPRVAAIDAHNHLGPTPFGGDWATRPPGELGDVLDAAGIAAIVDLDGGHGDALKREIERWHSGLQGRVAVFAGLDYEAWQADRAFGDREAKQLGAAVAAGHPRTTFVAAHVGCAAEALARVSAILERCPNFHVDIAARLGELGRQPYTSRSFFLRWPERILFGTDFGPDPAMYAVHYRFL